MKLSDTPRYLTDLHAQAWSLDRKTHSGPITTYHRENIGGVNKLCLETNGEKKYLTKHEIELIVHCGLQMIERWKIENETMANEYTI
jgi:hypothetical protein